MGTPDQWLEVLAMVKGLFNAITAGANLATLPHIDDWKNIYGQLGCHRYETTTS